MSDVYLNTRAFYDRRAGQYATIWGKADPHLRPFARKFVGHLPPAPNRAVKVLDTGTGTGRDVKMLLRRGYNAFGIDFSLATIELARQNNPRISDRLQEGDLRNLEHWHCQLRGIWDNATLHHVPAAESDLVMEQFKLALSTRRPGVLFLREKEGNGEGPVDTSEYPGEPGRFFKLYREAELRALVERHGFYVLESGVRPDRRDINFVWLFARLG